MENTAVQTGGYHGRPDGLSGSTLKIIAIVTMFIDHFAAAVLERMLEADRVQLILDGRSLPGLAWVYLVMRSIGRLSFPIFIFLLVEGFEHTRNRWKYLGRLAVFALISEIPFDLAFMLTDAQVFSGQLVEFGYQNVFFTLAIGLLVMNVLENLLPRVRKKPVYLVAAIAAAAVGLGLGYLLRTDYGAVGVLAIMVMYLLRRYRMPALICMCLALCLSNWSEIFTFFALIPLTRYNGTKGLQKKYFFYAFYPVHLFLLWCLCIWMGLLR